MGEPLNVEALGVRRATFGNRHPDTLTSINNLALLWEAQGKLAEAEPLYVEALGVRRATLGNQHPDTLTSINNLANLWHVQGKLAEAEPLFRGIGRTASYTRRPAPEHTDIYKQPCQLVACSGQVGGSRAALCRGLGRTASYTRRPAPRHTDIYKQPCRLV